MASDEDKKIAVQLVIEALERLAKVMANEPKDPFEGKHLSVIVMGDWADGELPENFIDEYVTRNAMHVLACMRCKESIAYFRTRRQKT